MFSCAGLYLLTWHAGLFLVLFLGQIGVNGRKQVRGGGGKHWAEVGTGGHIGFCAISDCHLSYALNGCLVLDTCLRHPQGLCALYNSSFLIWLRDFSANRGKKIALKIDGGGAGNGQCTKLGHGPTVVPRM